MTDNDTLNVAELLTQLSACQMRLHEAEAELRVLRPWAEEGRRAVKAQWWKAKPRYTSLCCDGYRSRGVHSDDCPIPALLAQLEDANE